MITDYKTGRAQSQEDSDESMQLSIYALAAREKWGYRADRLVLYNLEGNIAVMTRRSDAELEAAKSRVKEVSENVAAGKFQPKPGFYCKFCAYRNLCPATEKQLQDTRPRTKPPPHDPDSCHPERSSCLLREAAAESKDPYSGVRGRHDGLFCWEARKHKLCRAGRGPSAAEYDSQANRISSLRMTSGKKFSAKKLRGRFRVPCLLLC